MLSKKDGTTELVLTDIDNDRYEDFLAFDREKIEAIKREGKEYFIRVYYNCKHAKEAIPVGIL